jgi:hypothetical protein
MSLYNFNCKILERALFDNVTTLNEFKKIRQNYPSFTACSNYAVWIEKQRNQRPIEGYSQRAVVTNDSA